LDRPLIDTDAFGAQRDPPEFLGSPRRHIKILCDQPARNRSPASRGKNSKQQSRATSSGRVFRNHCRKSSTRNFRHVARTKNRSERFDSICLLEQVICKRDAESERIPKSWRFPRKTDVFVVFGTARVLPQPVGGCHGFGQGRFAARHGALVALEF
jgi:hypothetical protein